jgi:hypothetical protein
LLGHTKKRGMLNNRYFKNEINKGIAIGNDKFQQKIERITKQRMTQKNVRPENREKTMPLNLMLRGPSYFRDESGKMVKQWIRQVYQQLPPLS